MKKLTRMMAFTALAIFLTSFWDKGFIVPFDWQSFLKITLVIAALSYLIVPLTKLLLLPINILTFGLASTIAYFLLFYFLLSRFPLIQIKDWVFPGASFFGITIAKVSISYFVNIWLSAVSISTIINFLETFL